MAERSQKDIDALLDAPAYGDAPVGVVPYNFTRPPRVSKDTLASIDAVYGRFAAAVQAYLSSRLRLPVEVSVSAIEEVSYAEYVLSLGAPCAAFSFDAGDATSAHGIIEMTTPFSYHLIDRLFGGSGDSMDLPRPLTPLEQTVVRGVADRTLGLFAAAWAEDVAMEPVVASFEARAEMIRILMPDDSVLVAQIEVRSGPFTGPFSLCVPVSMFEAFLQQSGPARVVRSRTHDDDATHARTSVVGHLRQASVNVSVRFPPVRLPARAVANLAPGQVIHTMQPTDGSVDVMVNGRLRYAAALGQLRGLVGARVTQTVEAQAADRPRRPRQGRVE